MLSKCNSKSKIALLIIAVGALTDTLARTWLAILIWAWVLAVIIKNSYRSILSNCGSSGSGSIILSFLLPELKSTFNVEILISFF